MPESKIVRLTNIKLPYDHSQLDLENAVLKKLNADKEDIKHFRISRRSLDSRKSILCIVYTVLAKLNNAQKFISLIDNSNDINEYIETPYVFPVNNSKSSVRPVVAGAGPAGLFCALVLAENGFRPLIFERGETVGDRTRTVDHFWETGSLNPDSNIQFGEGGAGTFSDGKLNTGIKDRAGRLKKVLNHFVGFGAPEDILINSKPHIGTDNLKTAVVRMRKKIESLGGEFHFNSCVTDLIVEKNKLKAVEVNNNEIFESDYLVLATGHSARDLYGLLNNRGISMEQKVFAVGLRIEHPQEMISRSQYRNAFEQFSLPPAEYRLADKTDDGRGVYTFCMCPGGFVVNAASESQTCATNGMSNYKRDSTNANAAILVNVYPKDFASSDPLAGIEFQRILEKKAFTLGGSNYALPIQRFEDFLQLRASKSFGDIHPCTKGKTSFADLNSLFPEYINRGIKKGLETFGRKIRGFDHRDALLTGVESRSSSPIRILRTENMQSNISGIFPCGEGAGYAGGIMSAAIDGIKAAEAVAAMLE